MTDEIQEIVIVSETTPETLEPVKATTPKKATFPTPRGEKPSALAVELGGVVEDAKGLLEQLTEYGVLEGNPNSRQNLNAIKVIANRFAVDYRVVLNLIIRFNNH